MFLVLCVCAIFTRVCSPRVIIITCYAVPAAYVYETNNIKIYYIGITNLAAFINIRKWSSIAASATRET